MTLFDNLARPARVPGQAVRASAPASSSVLLAGAAALGAAALANYAAGRMSEIARPPTGQFVTIDGVKLHYIEKGQGPVVLLIHGNGTSVEDWVVSEVFDRLGSTHRVIAIDRPGFGYSDRPRGTVWTAEAQAGLLAGALRELGAEHPILVGHSWGTLVALAMALDKTVGARGLVLASGYYFPGVRPDIAGAWPAVPVLGDITRYAISPVVGRLLAGRVYRKLFAPAPVTADFARRFPLGLAMRPSQIRATAADTGLMVPAAAALSPRYGELDLPVTILSGDGDRIVDVAEQPERLHAELPGSDLRILPGLGHMIHHSAPGKLTAAVRAMPTG